MLETMYVKVPNDMPMFKHINELPNLLFYAMSMLSITGDYFEDVWQYALGNTGEDETSTDVYITNYGEAMSVMDYCTMIVNDTQETSDCLRAAFKNQGDGFYDAIINGNMYISDVFIHRPIKVNGILESVIFRVTYEIQ